VDVHVIRMAISARRVVPDDDIGLLVIDDASEGASDREAPGCHEGTGHIAQQARVRITQVDNPGNPQYIRRDLKLRRSMHREIRG